jgi:hypothetical protein
MTERRARKGVIVSTLLAGLMWACNDSPAKPSTTTTTFQGTLAGSNNQSGTLTVTVQGEVAHARPSLIGLPLVATLHAQSTSATGTLRTIGGSNVSLTGTFDSGSRILNLSGGGFTFTGTVSNGVLTGTYTGAGGASGTFSTRSTAGASVSVYCGSIFSSGNPNEVTGVFNLVIASTGGVSGAFAIIGSAGYLTGQVTGSSLSITYTNTTQNFTGTASGTIQGGSVSGISDSKNPFSGSTAACQ